MNNLAGSLIRNFEIKPDKVCLVQEGQKITYKNLYEKVVAFKHVMKEKGIILVLWMQALLKAE